MQIKNVLLYSPFDNKDWGKNLGQIDTENARDVGFFNSPLFIKYAEDWYKATTKNIFEILRQNSIVTFHGAASKGKTTFLKYISLAKNVQNSNSVFCFLNLIEDTSSNEDILIEDVLEKLIDRQFQENKDLICNKYVELINNNQKNIFFKDIDAEIFFREFIFAKQDGMTDDFYKNFKNVSENVSGTLYAENLLFIVMTNFIIIYEQQIKQRNNIVYIFDNLDELSHIYLVNNIYNITLNLYSRLQDIARFFDFSFEEYGRFILSFREPNSSLLPAGQITDRIYIRSAEFLFDPPASCSIREILVRRRDYFKNNSNKNNWEPSTELIVNTLDLLLDTDPSFLDNVINPMFNYDGRIIIDMIP